jgi:predicted transcriptional regulator
MATPARAGENSHSSKRKSILDLAPLELDCMNALWPLGEATVREVHEAVSEYRPRAYTTIMTILDRLARKGVVTRRKIGRAYLYRPNLTSEGARESAVARLVTGFFGGSRDELLLHLGSTAAPQARTARRDADRTGDALSAHARDVVSNETRSTNDELDETLL